MREWYKSKKVWIAALTATAQIVAVATGNPDLGEKLLMVGMALIGAIGLEDFGKAAKP